MKAMFSRGRRTIFIKSSREETLANHAKRKALAARIIGAQPREISEMKTLEKSWF